MPRMPLAHDGLDSQPRIRGGTHRRGLCLAGFVTRGPLSEVIRVQVGGRRYYPNRYRGSGKHLRRFIGRPRVLSEWRNLMLFQSWGIPAATVVAFGLERRGGLFHRGALLTEQLQDTAVLAGLASSAHP